MKAENIQIGDKLQIRQWDDMMAEFGGSPGAIRCKYTFYSHMRYLCGKTFTVRKISSDGTYYFSFENTEEDKWTISADMLEPIQNEQEDLISASDSELSQFLFGF